MAVPTANTEPSLAKPARVLILLCTYNEAGNIPKMFGLTAKHLPQAGVLVVDDNSPDGTGQIVTDFSQDDSRYNLLARSGKLGLGTATRDGLLWGLEHNYDFIINLDADHSHDPVVLPAILAACRDNPEVGVAVGSRYVEGGGFEGLAWHRKIISWVLNTYATRLLRLPIKDCSGSYRCYRASVLRQLDFESLTCPGYGFLEEILVGLRRLGTQFVEVPIRFETRFHGQSKLSLKDAWGAVKVIHQLAWRR